VKIIPKFRLPRLGQVLKFVLCCLLSRQSTKVGLGVSRYLDFFVNNGMSVFQEKKVCLSVYVRKKNRENLKRDR
jgi:hypothetical protein